MDDNRVPPYDMLLKSGHVIDPSNNIAGPMDVAIADGKIVSVAPDLPASQAGKTVSVEGLYVVPGLIDLHVHAVGYQGWLFPDAHALPNGATTVVDAGGAGWKSFEAFKDDVIAHSKTRVLAFLNIVGPGMLGAVEQDVDEMVPVPTAEMIGRYPDLLLGVKSAHFGGSGWESVDRAVEAGKLSNTSVMVDFASKPTRTYEDFLLKHLRPGDIHTHMYARHIPLLDERDRVNAYVREARDQGILFDVGHGQGSFWFRIAVPALNQGFGPDTISTDLHKASVLRPNTHLMAVLSKFLNMGMPLQEVIARCTVTPAQVIGHPELGTLSVGAEADVAVIEVREGHTGFVDCGHARLRGTHRLQCVLTLRAGEVVWDPTGLTCPDWETAGRYEIL